MHGSTAERLCLGGRRDSPLKGCDAQGDGAEGYILSRALDVHGRPVSFVDLGTPSRPDGSTVTLDAALLRKSPNFKALLAGEAYPLFYGFDTDAETGRDRPRRCRVDRTAEGRWRRHNLEREPGEP